MLKQQTGFVDRLVHARGDAGRRDALCEITARRVDCRWSNEGFEEGEEGPELMLDHERMAVASARSSQQHGLAP